MPVRLTRSRKRGAKTPDGAIYVGRPTLWGNPFTIDRFGHARCVILHKSWLRGELSDLALERMGFCPAEIEALHRKRARIIENFHRLIDSDLVCWCPQTSKWCHADTYLQMARAYSARMAA